MDLLFAYGNTGMLTLLRDGHAVATWEVTDLRAETKVSCYVSSAVSALLFNPFNLKYLIDLFTDTAAISISPPVLIISFHLNGHALGVHPQTHKLEPPCVA